MYSGASVCLMARPSTPGRATSSKSTGLGLVGVRQLVHQVRMAVSDATSEKLGRLSRLAEGNLSSDFDLNSGASASKSALREAAVLVPVIREDNDGYSVILTKRTSALRHHPGQIAFPGGKHEKSDASLIGTALREAEEEIGLGSTMVEVLGPVGTHETVTKFRVTPVLAMVDGAFVPKPDPGEVETVFKVPLAHILDPAAVRIEGRMWQGVLRKYYVIPHGPFYIWGATARIIVGLQSLWARADES